MKMRHGTTDRERVVFDDDIEVIDSPDDYGTARARRRFGGVDLPAVLVGTLAAIGTAVLLGGLLAAIGSLGYELDVERSAEKLSAGGFIAGLLTLLVSFAIGGWAAGRIARYDGGRNGLLTGVMFLVLAVAIGAAGAVLGSEYDVLAGARLPAWFGDWFDGGTTPSAIAALSAVVGVLVVLTAAWAGGVRGGRYHRDADRLIAHTRDGGLVQGRRTAAVVDSSASRRDAELRRSPR